MSERQDAVAARLDATRHAVDEGLCAYFAAKRREIEAISPRGVLLLDELETLTMRGGKRFRPIVLAAAHFAVREDARVEDAVSAGAAFELLQTYLLVHDDWMDQDLVRRGGPAVHASLRAKVGDAHLGDSLGILAGDLAGTLAWELLLRAPFPAARREEALAAYARLQVEVYLGQHLDCAADPDVSRMQDLKTGSYTVRGPLTLGALLGDASAEQLAALLAWGAPLGEAFQLRDDLLGTFGDAAAVGKPGDDLRHGKATALIAEARASLSDAARAPIDAVLGRADASEAELEAARRCLIETGVEARVTARLDRLVAQSEAALEAECLSAAGRALLRTLGQKLARRSR